jgi:hypothetical protein
MTEMLSSNLSYSQRLYWCIAECSRLEVQSVSAGQLGGEKFGLEGWVSLLCGCSHQSVVTGSSLCHEDIEDIIFVAVES